MNIDNNVYIIKETNRIKKEAKECKVLNFNSYETIDRSLRKQKNLVNQVINLNKRTCKRGKTRNNKLIDEMKRNMSKLKRSKCKFVK